MGISIKGHYFNPFLRHYFYVWILEFDLLTESPVYENTTYLIQRVREICIVQILIAKIQ